MDALNQRHNNSIGVLDEKVQKTVEIVNKLEEDVRVQVDRSIRDLESTDLRQQKEIADLNDQYKEFLKGYETFKELITRELREEFIKVNENFQTNA
jgi:predicted  nucleic acid-binding Zn-ribbon protein